MREYGGYIRETKRLLQNYAKMKVAVTNLTEEIEAQEKSGKVLRDVALMLFGVEVRPAQLKLVFISET